MKKIILILLIMFITTPAYAWQSKLVKKANDFIEAGMESEAIQSLEYGILETPKDHEAHWMLGKIYLERGSYSSAEKRFNSAVLLKPSLKSKLGNIYKGVADSSLNNGKTPQAVNLFDKALQYGSFNRQFYLDAGNRLSGVQAAKCYQKAALDKNLKNKAGKKILLLAVDDTRNREKFKQMGAGILGQDFVNRVFPKPYMKTIFETKKPLTFNDAFDKKHGDIIVCNASQHPMIKNDVIKVTARVFGTTTFSGKEILMFRGKNLYPKWGKTKNGFYEEKIGVNVTEGNLVVSLDGRKDVEVTVNITRKVYPKPNTALLSSA